MRIKLRCDPNLAGHVPEPQPARACLPDWLAQMPARATSADHGRELPTVKQCPPFVDAMTHGFMMPLPCDVHVADGGFQWDWDLPEPAIHHHPRAPLSFHVPEQLTGSPLKQGDQVAVKFNSFWTVELPEGYSLFATHPVNRFDLPFRLLTGSVVRCRPVGMLVAQCFPVARESLDLAIETMDEHRVAAYEAISERILGGYGVYRKEYRRARPRSVGPQEAPGGSHVEPE